MNISTKLCAAAYAPLGNDTTRIINVLGGSANVIAFRDMRFQGANGWQASGVNLTHWNDVRGSAVGLPLNVTTPGAHLTVTGTNASNWLLVGDGNAAAFAQTAGDARYDLISHAVSIFFVGVAQPWANFPYGVGASGGTSGAILLANSFANGTCESEPSNLTPTLTFHDYNLLDGHIKCIAAWRDPATTFGSMAVPHMIVSRAVTAASGGAGTYQEFIGSVWGGALPQAFSARAVIVMRGIATRAQIEAVTTWAITYHNAFNDGVKFVTWDGDSIANGALLNNTGTDYTMSYSGRSMQDARLLSYASTNIGVPNLQVSDLISRYSTDNRYTEVSGAGIYFKAGRTKDIVASNGGTNDLFFGASAATTFSRLQSYAALVHAQGRKIVQGTILPRNDNGGVNEAARATLNGLILGNIGSGSTQFDAVADGASDATMGLLATTGNATYYQSDHVHPTATGHSLLTPYWANAVASL